MYITNWTFIIESKKSVTGKNEAKIMFIKAIFVVLNYKVHLCDGIDSNRPKMFMLT